MKRSFGALLILVFVSACGGGGDIGAIERPPPSVPPPTASEQLAADLAGLNLTDFYDVSYEALIYREPESIAWNKLESVYPVEFPILDDLRDAHKRETLAMVQVALDALQGYDRDALSDAGKLDYDFYEWYLQDRLDHLDFIYHDFVATYNFAGIHNNTERLFTDILPLETAQDAEDYLFRIDYVLLKFRQLIDHLNLQSGAGIIEPGLTMDVAIAGLNEIADAPTTMEGVSYFERFIQDIEDIAELDDDERAALQARCRDSVRTSVRAAYRELRAALQGLRANAPDEIGVGQYPSGGEYYDYILRHHTTTNRTAAEIHQLGLDHLQLIHAEMQQIFDQLGYPQDETLQELFARVTTDGGVIPAVDVKPTHEAIIAAAELNLDQAFDIFPSADVVVAEDQFGGFYIGPSFDGTRPGTFYAGTANPQPWFQLPSLTYHESVPGHHTQVAIAMEQPGHMFRRVERFTALVEGWALYAERLAFELGWYANDPYGDLGRLQFEALRAARLVMDTGIHSLGWTFEQAVQFNIDNVGASLGASEGAAARYSVVPGQATAYMIGMLHILDARQRAMDQLGAAFDLKEFHRVVLTGGGVPLPLLDNLVDAWIAEKLAAQ